MNSDKTKEILLVDDMPKNLQVLASQLSEVNYQITMATNGESALKSLEPKAKKLYNRRMGKEDPNLGITIKENKD